jgi:hypothetical protein
MALGYLAGWTALAPDRGIKQRCRIRSHIQLCWLALLLIRVVENATGDTWRNVRHEPDRMHLVTLQTPHGRVAKRSVTTARQRALLGSLELHEPPPFLDRLELPAPAP